MTIPEERIDRLASLAAAAIDRREPDLARRYVRRARRIAERNRLRMPRAIAHRTCDRCDVYLVPGVNARIRLQDGHVVVTCECGEHARYPYR